MRLAGSLDQPADVREFSFRVEPDRIGRLDMPKGYRHFGCRRACDSRCTPRLSRGRAAVALLLDFTHHVSRAERHPICLRFADGGIPIACRYLATVRRAMLICLARSISAIAWSDNGFCGVSAVTIPRICSLTVSALTSSPPAPFTPEVKKNLSS